MLTIDQCRRLASPLRNCSDEEVRGVRDGLYSLARVVTSHYRDGRHVPRSEEKTAVVVRPYDVALRAVPVAHRVEVEERAAILENESGLGRDAAERRSFASWIEKNR